MLQPDVPQGNIAASCNLIRLLALEGGGDNLREAWGVAAVAQRHTPSNQVAALAAALSDLRAAGVGGSDDAQASPLAGPGPAGT